MTARRQREGVAAKAQAACHLAWLRPPRRKLDPKMAIIGSDAASLTWRNCSRQYATTPQPCAHFVLAEEKRLSPTIIPSPDRRAAIVFQCQRRIGLKSQVAWRRDVGKLPDVAKGWRVA